MKRTLQIMTLLLAFGACGSPTLDGASFDTACVADQDCVGVFLGDPCSSACDCPNAAINKSDLARYQSDLAADRAACSSKSACVADCVAPTATCKLGVCTH
jgi:hypothetical protein